MDREYKEAPDKYSNIDDFIMEFSNEKNDCFEVNWGMDFWFAGESYHMCRYQTESNEQRKKFSLLLGFDLKEYQFEMILNKKTKSEFSFGNITIIGFYKDIYDMLENCLLENISFKELLLSGRLVITGKD